MIDLDPQRLDDLLNRISRGGHQAVGAYAVLYRHYWPQLAHFYQFTFHDKTIGEDIAHEALLRAMRKLDAFDGSSRFSTWLHGFGRNLAREKKKELAIRVARYEEDGEGILDSLIAERGDPVAALEAAQIRGRFDECMDKMSAGHREVAWQFYVEGLSCEEIGVGAQIPPGTVKSRLSKVRRLLTDCLSRKGIKEEGR